MKQDYYEKIISKLIPIFIIQILLVLGLLTPLVQTQLLLKWGVLIAIALSLVLLFRVLLVSRPVLIIEENNLFIRGVRPGFWKFFQLWHNERMRLDEIVKIQVGKIRGDFYGFKIPPLGEPSKNACFQKFLWITYKRNGELMEIYYPHTPQIKNFDKALQTLQSLKKNLRRSVPKLIPDASADSRNPNRAHAGIAHRATSR